MGKWRAVQIAGSSIASGWRHNFHQKTAFASSSTLTQSTTKTSPITHSVPVKIKPTLPPLSVMPTSVLLRSLLVTYVLSSPRIVGLSLPILDKISHSDSWLLNSDRNPVLHFVIRKLFYDHFCAGENEREVRSTIAGMKKMGFEGVILGYAKETVVSKCAGKEEAAVAGKGQNVAGKEEIEVWKDGNMRTLGMLGRGDYLAVKLTGAGPTTLDALAMCKPPSTVMAQALSDLCEKASKQGTFIWIDAEQQIFQPTIDCWTVDLMRRYNRGGKVLIYNTFQAYLKGTPKNITKHLKLSQEEGWVLGIKLVRGAYIAVEPRHLIHDTIEDTHAAYDSIVQSLLKKEFPGSEKSVAFPEVQLMLASHNAESVSKGFKTWRDRNMRCLPTIKMEIGQLQGMADEVSCGLVQTRQQMESNVNVDAECAWYPRAFKCLCWGGTQECVQFLMRRVTENKGSLERTKEWMAGLKKELLRRIRVSLRLS